MGQQAGTPMGCSCPAEQRPPGCSGCPTGQRPGSDRAAYLAQFTGNSSATHAQHLRNLETRHSFHGESQEDEVVHPSLRRPATTDLFTYGAGDVQSCCNDCAYEDPCQVLFGQREQEYLHMPVQMRADGQVLPEELPEPIAVPPDFRLLEYDWTAPSETQKEMPPEQVQRLHTCLKLFIRAMLIGVVLQLRLDAEEIAGKPLGQNIDAIAMLTQDLTTLLLSAGGVQRNVPLQSVRWVRPPTEESGGLSFLLPSERGQMVVLRLAGSCFLRLRFDQPERAAYFGTCLRLFLKGNR